MPCPCCQGALYVIGSRPRTWIHSDGHKTTLIIRRLRCRECRSIHHELPNLLVPFRRYEAAGMEQAIEEPSDTGIAAEESTLRRWRQWFAAWAVYAVGCLGSIARRYGHQEVETSLSPLPALQRMGHLVGDAPGWLARVVRPLANLHLWLQTRSAFLS